MNVPTLTAYFFAVTLLSACGERKPQVAPAAPVVVVDPCSVEADLLARAKFLATGSPQNAVEILQPCTSTLSPESLKFLAQVTSESDARKAKLLAAEQAKESKDRKVRAEVRAREKADRRREGVSIGMTREEVLDSMWGKPQSINRTTGAYGTHEQWVYRGRNYLYFENGVLTTIQN